MNTEQLRAEFEAWTDNHYYLSELNNIYLDDDYVDPEMQAAWEGYQAGRAALQSQDEDIFSPTSLTGLSKDELIRQLQWALNYWMPNIADDGTPDGERAAREAYLLLGMQAPVGRKEENTPTYWERVSDLQSQDRDDVTVLKVALEESRQTMKAVLAQERLKDVAKRCLSRTIGITDRAIDHARRIEGGET